MAQSVSIFESSAKRYEPISVGAAAWIRQTGLNKYIGKTFTNRRVRANTIYILLIASIAFTLLNAIMTCSLIRRKDIGPDLVFQNIGEFNPLWFSSFVLLALTCSLALVTIIRKDKSNGRLLSKLRLTNRELENKVHLRTKELAEAIRAKDHFLGIATHDLKAPLNGILGLVQLIKIENDGRFVREGEYLGHIEYSCKTMQGLIHDILEINRIEQGRAIVRRELIDLAGLLNKLWIDFAPEAGKKNIELVFEEIGATIETDAGSLRRILENLLSNAIKFSPPMRKVLLRVSLEFNTCKFEVSDEGPGIPPEEQPKLFSKFQRLSNRPTGEETSTGLGLSIVKELTTRLGGEIAFNSEVGKGSTFIVMLPECLHNVSEIQSIWQTSPPLYSHN